jgi:glutamate dehydrogenase
MIVGTVPGEIPDVDVAALERRMIDAGRTYADDLRDALIAAHGEERGLALLRIYRDAFAAGYRERFSPAATVADIARVETVLTGPKVMVEMLPGADTQRGEIALRIIHRGQPMALSDVMPLFENMGLRVENEVPYRVEPYRAPSLVWIQEFTMVPRQSRDIDLAAVKTLFEDAFIKVWRGAVENDGFNRLVLAAGLSAREIAVLRAYAKYLRQVGIPFSQAYMEDTLAGHPKCARKLIELFGALLDPATRQDADQRAAKLVAELGELLDAVTNLDEDRILRRFLNLVRSTVRTNAYQHDAHGKQKPYLSFKLDSQALDELPLPRPLVEIFVCSPQVEGIHLRGGRVARGGIRWSDRREDFRTEILGLMKAQMVKNAVIVPVGSKGGFFVKKPPPPEAGRDAALAEGVACYKTLMRGLLDLTDNITPGGIVPPKGVVRRDGDDPYLVVAADKGTATFSDIANGVSREYGFWLDDAFASGGSAGYDHKAMGITARGAWEAVKRHFRELGLDTQTTDFTVVGIGDMSGDVFGNGMLRSAHIKLVGAFDHRHIFVDPTPDAAASFAERERLFKLPRSSWADFAAALISKGGGVFDRKAKSIRLTPEIKALFDIAADQVTPADLIKAMLKARVDLLWLGGIGTYVKAAGESAADVGDRANDAVRVDGHAVRARVVGEGANLGFTQRGRVEYARQGAGGQGGRIDTDAIDNSAGVDTSDHEVNIKILLGDTIARGEMTMAQRDTLLASMTDEVGALVLLDNYLQTQALSLAQRAGIAALEDQVRLMRTLERAGQLNRALEFLPDDDEIRQRAAGGKGLTRPELSVLLAYAKIALNEALLPSDLPDDPHLAADLQHYFPAPLAEGQRDAIGRHRLRREIIATAVTNEVVNRAGICFINDAAERSRVPPTEVTRAYMVVRDTFELPALWRAIEALDGMVATDTQYRMLGEVQLLVDRVTPWLLRVLARPIAIAGSVARFAPAVGSLRAGAATLLDAPRQQALSARAAAYAKEGVPDELAQAIALLDSLAVAPMLATIAEGNNGRASIEDVARRYFSIGARLGLDWLREAAGTIKAETVWQRRAIEAAVDDLNAHQADFAARATDDWESRQEPALRRVDGLLAELRMAPNIDLAALTIAARELRLLTGT